MEPDTSMVLERSENRCIKCSTRSGTIRKLVTKWIPGYESFWKTEGRWQFCGDWSWNERTFRYAAVRELIIPAVTDLQLSANCL